MTSDVREARILKLVPEASAGDEAVQRALENRLLILHEMTRAQPADPGRDAIAARRQVWTAALAGGHGPAGIDDQMRDDQSGARRLVPRRPPDRRVRRRSKFGQPGDPGRDAKIQRWIADLQRNARICVKSKRRSQRAQSAG